MQLNWEQFIAIVLVLHRRYGVCVCVCIVSILSYIQTNTLQLTFCWQGLSKSTNMVNML